MKPNRLWLAVASSLMASQLMAGEAVFYVTEEGEAVRDLAVSVNGQKKLVGKSGFVSFTVDGGSHTVELSKYGEFWGEFDFETANADQNAEIQVEMIGGEALPEVNVYTPGNEEVVALGQISGYLMSDDTGGAIAGARVSVEGTEQGVVTDEDGFFSFELARGEYNLLIADPNYGQRDVSAVRVMANVNTGVNLNMSLDGEGVIEEVVAVGSYIPSTATAQERDSSAVLDSIGSEQMARFGDSNAASALKRVAGVTIAGGKYVVARGLNERHTSIMLNGASLPSPDPSRRVVPLDIFPSSTLDGINVQKTMTPNLYADSTGSTVMLTTKKFPSEFEGKISAKVGYTDGLTFESRTLQQSQSLDFLGFGSTGDRELPGVAKGLRSDTADQAYANSVAQDMSSNLTTEDRTVLPDVSLEVSAGNTLIDNNDISLGYTASIKYSNEWAKQDGEMATNNISGGQTVTDDEFDYTRTMNDINLGMALSLGLIHGESEYSSNTMLLRQTQASTTRKAGVGGDQDRQLIAYDLDWQERQFFFQQFTGDHVFSELSETDVNWELSFSQASLNNPDRRSYSFEIPEGTEDYLLYWSSVDRNYNELTDNNFDASVNLKTMIFSGDSSALNAQYGFSTFSRSRDADGTQLGYYSNPTRATGYPNEFDIDKIIAETVNDGQTYLINNTAGSSDYEATWDLTAYYLNLEFDQFDSFKVNVGARAEDSAIQVDTYEFSASSISTPEVQSKLDDSEVFLSLGSTVFLSEELQLRAAYYQTQNRPDFRELANAAYTDPESGDTIRGYDKLISSDVENMDARLEYYFSDNESVSVAYFNKDFDNPIERTLLTGGEIFSYRNGETGNVNGFEVDFRIENEIDGGDLFFSGNASFIESEVDIRGVKREMQGQPDQLANFQFGFDHYQSATKYTLVLNHQGESLYSAAQEGSSSPEIIRESRSQIDFNFSLDLENDFSVNASLKNIFDEEHSLTQNKNTYRSYKTGMELSVGGSMRF